MEVIFKDFIQSVEQKSLAFVMEVQGQIVGMSVLEQIPNIQGMLLLIIRLHVKVTRTDYKSRYQLEDFVLFQYHDDDAHLRIIHYVLNPVFDRCNRHLIRVCCVYVQVDSRVVGIVPSN